MELTPQEMEDILSLNMRNATVQTLFCGFIGAHMLEHYGLKIDRLALMRAVARFATVSESDLEEAVRVYNLARRA